MTEDITDFRPENFDGFIGQAKLKERLTVQIEAAKADDRPLGHVFLSGPAGFGKTTLAHLIADLLGDPITILTGRVNEKTLVRTVRAFEGGILFLDEIHALAKQQQESILPLLTNGTMLDSKGREYQTRFLTVIAATTERDKVIAPLLSRFPIVPDFVPYTDDEMCRIVQNMARANNVRLDKATAKALGRAAGGVPRAAEALVVGAHDLAVTDHPVDAQSVLALCGVDSDGLTALHVRYLEVLHSQGNQAGQKTIEMLLRIPPLTIRELERLLLERTFIEYSSTGRELTTVGEHKLKGTEQHQYRRSR